jgi:hypothetical protein
MTRQDLAGVRNALRGEQAVEPVADADDLPPQFVCG